MKSLYRSFVALVGMLCLGNRADGQQYPPNIPVSRLPESETETAIAVSPLNSNYVIAGWNDRTSPGLGDRSGYAFSFDGGQTWTGGIIMNLPDSTQYPLGIDPSVAFDTHGDAFFCHIGGTSSGVHWIRVWKRTVPNGNWTQKPVSKRAATWPTNDKPYMAVDNTGFTSPGNIYVAWTEYQWPQGSTVKFNRSTNGGDFDTLAVVTLDTVHNTVDQSDLSYISLLGALPVVGPSGELYVFWARGSGAGTGGDGTIAFRKSTDGGATWNPPLSSGPASTVQFHPRFQLDYGNLQIYTFPSAAIDSNGNAYLAFAGVPPNSTVDMTTVYLIKSTNGGTTWSDTIKTNQPSSGFRFMPWLTVDKWNALHVVYYHGPDGSSANTYIATMFTNESTFGFPDVRLNDVSINALQVGRKMHYLGVSASPNGSVLPCWTDTRNWSSNLGDVYSTLLNLSSPQAPGLSRPPNRAPLTSDNLNFSWDPAFGARKYRFQLDDDPAFGSPFEDSVTTTEYHYSGNSLIVDTRYYWRVRSENSIGVGSFSTPASFVLRAAVNVQTSYPLNWNLAAVPLYIKYFHADSVWRPSAMGGPRVSGPFIYDPVSGYVPVSQLQDGPGYWVKFSPAPTIPYSGGGWDTLDVPVTTNWNIIGSIHVPVDTSTIRYVGATTRVSSYFKYGSTGYTPVGTLEPGFGYWVKFNPGGTIRLPASAIFVPPAGDELATYDKFTLTDASGKQQDLYVRNGERPSEYSDQYWEMPPVPPEQSFDVRLETDMLVKTVGPTPDPVDLTFLMTGIEFPATLNWQINPENGITYSFPDSGAGLGKVSGVSRTGNLTFTAGSNRIRLKAWVWTSGNRRLLPTVYQLQQNYPNPFNPTTTIKYDLPLDTEVSLRLYDVLGREVKTIVDGLIPAGFHQVTVDGSNLASGVYLYRIDAGPYTQVKKLLLIK